MVVRLWRNEKSFEIFLAHYRNTRFKLYFYVQRQCVLFESVIYSYTCLYMFYVMLAVLICVKCSNLIWAYKDFTKIYI